MFLIVAVSDISSYFCPVQSFLRWIRHSFSTDNAYWVQNIDQSQAGCSTGSARYGSCPVCNGYRDTDLSQPQPYRTWRLLTLRLRAHYKRSIPLSPPQFSWWRKLLFAMHLMRLLLTLHSFLLPSVVLPLLSAPASYRSRILPIRYRVPELNVWCHVPRIARVREQIGHEERGGTGR